MNRFQRSGIFLMFFAFVGSGVLAQNASASEIKVYPNPWRVDQDRNYPMIFGNLPSHSSVGIYTISGELVRSLPQGTNTWDLTNSHGERVASGVYLYLIFPQDITGKLAVIQ